MIDTSLATRGKYTDIERLVSNIDNGPYDAVIVNSPENIPYYSGFWNMDLRTIPERVHFVVWPKGGEPAFVVTERRAMTLKPGDTFLTDIQSYQGEALDSVRAVSDVLKNRGITKGKIAIEGRNFPGGHLVELMRLMPEIDFVDGHAFLEKPRLIKTPAEIEVITQVCEWTTRAIDTAWAEVKPGDTERAIASRMQYELLKNGADQIIGCVFGSGERTGYFHGLATDAPIEAGTLLSTDFVGMRDGYFSDVARTAVMGKASDYQRDMHAKVSEIKNRVVDFIKPGMLASEVDKFARQQYEDLGLEYKWAIVGHSIGLGVHESPQIYPWVDEEIQPGMAMMIELGYQDYPNESFHVEDLIVVTEERAEYRSDFSRHETIWELGV